MFVIRRGEINAIQNHKFKNIYPAGNFRPYANCSLMKKPFPTERDGQLSTMAILAGRSNEQRQKLRSVYASKQKRDLISDLRAAAKDNFYGEMLASKKVWLFKKIFRISSILSRLDEN